MRSSLRLPRRWSQAFVATQRLIQRSRRRKRHHARIGQESASFNLVLEVLENRLLLTVSPVATPDFMLGAHMAAGARPNQTTAASAPYTPAQLATAYGVNLISFGGTSGTGAGQTVAIIDAYNDPDIVSDANSFSSEFGLPQFNGSGEPTLTVLNQSGGTSLPSNAAKGGWDIEESLDVEWVHSIAPEANIILFEANSNSLSNLFTAVATAADYSGVSVVSMSWGASEFSEETNYDSYFVTPSGHQPVTFLASTGDDGTPAEYPAYSPNVVAVGGTSLSIESNGTYLSESAWDDEYGAGGGGISQYEAIPSYQSALAGINGASTTNRNAPDVSMDADVLTGVYVLDSYDGGWFQVGGTSLSVQTWAGLIAIADQGRVLAGEATLNGATQTLPMLYDLPSSDFHDITTGTNGTYPAAAGYDLATGIGTPVANLLVPALVGTTSTTTPTAPTISAPSSESLGENSDFVFSGTSAISVGDASIGSNLDTVTLSVSHGLLTLGPTSSLSTVTGDGSGSVSMSGTLSALNAALASLTYTPSSGYSGSDSLAITITDPGDHQSNSATVALTITSLAAPKITAPASVSLPENDSVEFVGAITITDSAAGSNTEQLALSATHGTLRLGSTAGITIVSGSNRSGSMTIKGTLSSLNSALYGLLFTPTSNYTGSASISLTYTDSTDNLTGSATIGITLTSRAARTLSGQKDRGGEASVQPFRNNAADLELDPLNAVQLAAPGSGDAQSAEINLAELIGSSVATTVPSSYGFVGGSGSGDESSQGIVADSPAPSEHSQTSEPSVSQETPFWEGVRAALAELFG